MNEPWLRGKKDGFVDGPQGQVAEVILQVPLVEDVIEDKLIWKEEKNGIYSVRSGYRLWREDQCPTGCQFCDANIEDDWHILFACSTTIQCWRAAGLYSIIESRLTSFDDARALIFDICSREDRKIVGRVAVMLEVIWRNRNNKLWNNEQEDATTLGLISLSNWQAWLAAQKVQITDNHPQHLSKWDPPNLGWFKCNVDAGFNSQKGTTNRGWCVRDNFGHFIFAGAAWDVGTYSILEAEVMALKEAILGAINLNLRQVIFESDSQMVVQALRTKHSGSSEFSLTVSSLQNLLLSFPNFEVKFIKRQANSVAHSLAKAANSWSRRSNFHLIPPCIEHLLINDMS
ncbi:uncharacterized protein LOC131604482 [Vicia villosa]|uniref:uncharacterized protein LOC131604482 n=1 Tax=Vicia villosa TaxID=3911 RepID=UPI00273C0479|nr:uncharacterized protein LOC131604482 [Vicia villosa]